MTFYICISSPRRCKACLKEKSGSIKGHVTGCPYVGLPIDENGEIDWHNHYRAILSCGVTKMTSSPSEA